MLSLDELLIEARSGLTRVAPEEFADAVDRGALVVDVRDTADRAVEGSLPGAVLIASSVLEWRLAPTSQWRSHHLTADDEVIIVCNDGCASSLAARNLQRLGLLGATDLIGGFRALAPILPAVSNTQSR